MSQVAAAARAAAPLQMNDDRKRANVRTALILLSIALVFFFGVMAKYWLIGK